MAQKICCGGFELGEGLELDDKRLSVGEGAGLPTVAEVDDGKVLGVEDGKWKVVEQGSGLPDPTGLADGTALVKVGWNEWKTQAGYGYNYETNRIWGEIHSSPAYLSPGAMIYHMTAPTCHLTIKEGFTYRTLYDADVTWGPEFSQDTRVITVQDVDNRTWTFSVEPTGEPLVPHKIQVATTNLPNLGADISFTNVSSFAEPTYIPFNKNYIPDAVPDYTAADEGKVLKIVNGGLAWVAET